MVKVAFDSTKYLLLIANDTLTSLEDVSKRMKLISGITKTYQSKGAAVSLCCSTAAAVGDYRGKEKESVALYIIIEDLVNYIRRFRNHSPL